MKFFNTAGPVNRDNHYKIDPLTRWNMDEILTLIEQEKLFAMFPRLVSHAPRHKNYVNLFPRRPFSGAWHARSL